MATLPVRRALLSVSDKRGLVELASALVARGVELISTGGTHKQLSAANIPVIAVAHYTGEPEILDGRVKTLHPKIHGGVLARATDAHRAELAEHAIDLIDLVVVNLYPFEQTVARPEVALADAIENIDIGGPTMVRAAAKNFERVSIVVDPDDYTRVLSALDAHDGTVPDALRFEFARKAFSHTAAYDFAIANYLESVVAEGQSGELPPLLAPRFVRASELRYGENPHQRAAFYRSVQAPAGAALADADVVQGKPLSYNNLLDLDAALACCVEHVAPTAVIVKHTNPCGVASDVSAIARAYELARECDPVSAFGGIVAVNREVDAALAAHLAETFLECVIAPSYADDARRLLAAKKNLRLLALPSAAAAAQDRFNVRSVRGGLLVQTPDDGRVDVAQAKVVTRRAPTADQLASLEFAWRVVKHVKSNAILFASGQRTVAIGAGQMSRVDAVALAVDKAVLPTTGACAASDAFFPFRDGIDALAASGVSAVIQPGGSMRDDEVIAAADEHGLAMVFTGMRHFRH